MRKRPASERVAAALREVQVDVAGGMNVDLACRKVGISLTTYYRWKARGAQPVSPEETRIAELEDEVGRLKSLVAEIALDRRMLQEALKKKP